MTHAPARLAASPRRFAILSVGASDGVRIGMPVRSPDGLVGRIIEAGALASRVLLVSDRANIVPARLLRGIDGPDPYFVAVGTKTFSIWKPSPKTPLSAVAANVRSTAERTASDSADRADRSSPVACATA